MSNKYKLIYVASAVLSAAIFLIGRENVVRFSAGSPAHKVGLTEIRDEFAKIRIHDEDRWIESPVAFDKNSIDGISGNLRSSSTPGEIVAYYRKSVRDLGWVEVGSKKGENGQSIKFCKNGVSLFVDASTDGASTNYYIGAVWTEYSALESYCPQTK